MKNYASTITCAYIVRFALATATVLSMYGCAGQMIQAEARNDPCGAYRAALGYITDFDTSQTVGKTVASVVTSPLVLLQSAVTVTSPTTVYKQIYRNQDASGFTDQMYRQHFLYTTVRQHPWLADVLRATTPAEAKTKKSGRTLREGDGRLVFYKLQVCRNQQLATVAQRYDQGVSSRATASAEWDAVLKAKKGDLAQANKLGIKLYGNDFAPQAPRLVTASSTSSAPLQSAPAVNQPSGGLMDTVSRARTDLDAQQKAKPESFSEAAKNASILLE